MIGENIRAARKTQNMSQVELARRCGISRGYLLLVESGESNPTITKVGAIAGALGMTVDDLINGARKNSTEAALLYYFRLRDWPAILRLVAVEIQIEQTNEQAADGGEEQG